MTSTFEIRGEAGSIHGAIDTPNTPARGWALLLHPHPLFGGSRNNKVVTTLGRACVQAGLLTLRPDFRGVGQSAGTFDEGHGETRDMLELVQQMLQRQPELRDQPFVLGGFSFGSVVASRLLALLEENQLPLPTALLMIGTATERFEVAPVPAHTLVVHGEIDDTVSLGSVLEWARPQDLPVVVVPGASHFFHGKLVGLKHLVTDHLRLRLDCP